MNDTTPITVYRDNRVDQQETYTAAELFELFARSECASFEWPIERRVATWLAGWAVMDAPVQYALTAYIADRRINERALASAAPFLLSSARAVLKMIDAYGHGGIPASEVYDLRTAIAAAEGYDTVSSASRQHYIDTGRFMRIGEVAE